MEKVIEFLKKDFPKDALDIQECLELLFQSIAGSVESIRSAYSTAFDKRDFVSANKMQEVVIHIDTIQNKLDEYINLLQLDDEVEEVINKENMDDESKELPDYESLRVDQNIPYTLYNDYTHKRPAGFEIFEIRHEVKDWKEMFVKTCEVLAEKDPNKFLTFVNDKSMRGKKLPYFCTESTGIRSPKKIKDTNVYVMTNMSANQIRNVVEKMLRKYEIKVNDYKIFLKADYTARH
ncbi:MAG TPA: hypothetical protein DDZ89_07310 [Clostridiales bacterium]|nr:hypothetical protein [Clostridiales bacterium]